MIKSELIRNLAAKMTHLPEHKVEQAIHLILATLSNTLIERKRIEIRGFRSFAIRQVPERRAHNPKTGEKVIVPAKDKVYFKPGRDLKQRLITVKQAVPLEDKKNNKLHCY